MVWLNFEIMLPYSFSNPIRDKATVLIKLLNADLKIKPRYLATHIEP